MLQLARAGGQIPIPHFFSFPPDAPAGALQLRSGDGERIYPAQRDGTNLVVMVPPGEPGGEFRLEPGVMATGVSLDDTEEGALVVRLPEGPFFTYHYGANYARPFCFPLLGPGGVAVTRAYPMIPDVPGESRDHPHHRSLWSAYGEVNDVDDWSEEPGHGYIRHQSLLRREQGPVCGGFTAAAVWTAADGSPLLDESRTITAYNVGPEYRLLDYTLKLTASYGPVTYGDTKEAGLLALRVATSMDGDKGGLIRNSEGGRTEAECWGLPARWLAYSGPAEDEVLGVALMDHPGNPGHPCRWHARDYGLVGANPFAVGAFTEGELRPVRQEAGETLCFRYRVLIHRGTAESAQIETLFRAWSPADA